MNQTIVLAGAVAAGLTLILVLLRTVVPMIVQARIRSALREVEHQGLGQQPDRINLVHHDLRTWRPDPAVASFADRLFSKGFQEAGLFAIKEMPGVLVRFMAKPAEGLIAAIYIHPVAGVWLDLATFYQDGRSSTFSCNPAPGLSQHPNHRTVYSPGKGAFDLLAECLAQRPRAPFKPILPEDVAPMFENSYAEAIAWRKGKGTAATESFTEGLRKAA